MNDLRKRFYSLPDKALVKQVPQPLQHLINNETARQRSGEIVYYTMEDPFTLATQEILISKVNEKPKIDGFVFFTLDQFGYSGKINLSLMEWILSRGYELHFARENLSLLRHEDLEREFPLLYTHHFVEKRDSDTRFLASVCRGMD